jgi:MFS family permease
MLAPSSELLRAGLGLKLNQLKRATQSYLRDRSSQATSRLASYAGAAGLFAVACIFAIAAVFVALIALYRWVGIKYGMFWGLGAVGSLLLLMAVFCAAVAARRLKRKPPHFPTLTSRLRVAVTASPLQVSPTDALKERTAAALKTAGKSFKAPMGKNRPIHAGLVLAASLLGWAAVRRTRMKRRKHHREFRQPSVN